MNIILKAAQVIDPQSPFHLQTVDIQIENGEITAVGTALKPADFKEIHLPNLQVSSGWMDSSVSFGEPGYEERETLTHGLGVAALSGFTHVAIQPNTYPVVDTQSTVSFIKQKAMNCATVALPIGALTKNSEGADLAELYDMQNAGAIAFGDYKKPLKNSNLLKIALQYTQDFNALVLAFSMDKDLQGQGVVHEGIVSTRMGLKGIPALAEEIQLARNLQLLEYTGGKLHLPTISSAQSVQLVREAKSKGLKVSCSVAVHQLALNDEVLNDFDSRYKVMPPIRDESHRLALIEGVLDGTIDCITSDHNPLDIEHKKMEFNQASYGTTGLESAFGILLDILPLEVVISKLTAAKAIFNIKSSTIAVGEKACLSLFTAQGASIFTREDILSKSKNSALLDQKTQGAVYGIYNQNQLILK